MFLQASVILFKGRGVPVPDQVHPLGPGIPPGTRCTPWDQVHPPGPGTPPWTRYTPPDQVHTPQPGTPPGTKYTPWTRYTPQPGTPPGPGVPPPPQDQVCPPGTRYTPLDQVHTPRPGTHPLTRYTPQDQVHPHWTRYTPPDQVHPPGPGTPQLGPGTPLRTRYTPQTRYTPPPLDQVHPLGPGTPPRTRYPPWRRTCWEIWSMHGRYASCWNAILFVVKMQHLNSNENSMANKTVYWLVTVRRNLLLTHKIDGVFILKLPHTIFMMTKYQ